MFHQEITAGARTEALAHLAQVYPRGCCPLVRSPTQALKGTGLCSDAALRGPLFHLDVLTVISTAVAFVRPSPAR
jgi:hypothetical protein